MAGVYHLDIKESEAELKKLLAVEKTGSGKERLQVLYLLKTTKAKIVTDVAEILGRNRVTVRRGARAIRPYTNTVKEDWPNIWVKKWVHADREKFLNGR